MNWYILLLSQYPWVILLSSGLLSIISIICSLTLQDLPDFSDPQEGFESRGTSLSDRLTTWDNLLDSISHVGPLTTNPIQPVTQARAINRKNRDKRKRKRKKKKKSGGGEEEAEDGVSRWRRDLSQAIPSLSSEPRAAWLCGDPMAEFSHVVYQSTDGSSLFSYKSIISMCSIETVQLKSVSGYTDLCETKGPADCCPGWSLGGYIALLYNRTSCFTITESDVSGTLGLLAVCAPYYRDGRLTARCGGGGGGRGCQGVPQLCSQHNAIHTIFHYLTDLNFSRQEEDEEGTNFHLSYAVSFLPLARSSQMLDYYNNIDKEKLCDGVTQVVAMDFGLKDTLFNTYLVEDASYLLFGLLLVFLSVWSFTTSLTVTIASITSIAFSLGLAYFTYTFIFRLSFFPFMNILAVIIALGVGADDTFILSRVWQEQTCTTTTKLESLVSNTLHHSLLSMLVTSITTTVAFFSSYISNITAIKCFSVFAGLTILWNLVLMLSWVPAWLVLHHDLLVVKLSAKLPSLPLTLEPVFSLTLVIARWIRGFYEKILPQIIVKPRVIWICLSFTVIILACLATFYKPGLKLPENSELQLFKADHPFEKYEMVFKTKFAFERSLQRENSLSMPLRFVWGPVSQDTGNHLNPADRGNLLLDPDFDISSREAQSWMYKFCNSIKKQPFYKYNHGDLQLSNCFILTFKDWMYRPCYNDLSKENHRPCCRDSVFPYDPEVFNQCLLLAVDDLYETPSFLWLPGVAGPKFDIKTKKVTAMIVEYESTVQFSYDYQKMNEFYQEVESWFQSLLADAPPQLQNGFFINFYDLQKSLFEGTFIAIGVAMTMSFLVLVVSTRNILLSLFAILTVFSIILITVGILVMLGWELNILESVVITLAIGLSVDFTLHYGIMYKLSTGTERTGSVRYSLATMASPVTMAAFTTLAAGLCLLPARVMAYIQIGTFIVVLMTISWIFSTFFFQSLLSAWGPSKSSNLNLPTFICCSVEEEEDVIDEVENIKKAFTVSDTIMSRVSDSHSELEFSNGGHGHHNALMDREMIGLTISRREERDERDDVTRSVKQRRSQSCSQEGEERGFRSSPCNRYSHTSQISPGRKSLHEPLFVSDGFTIRSDPQQQQQQHSSSLHRQHRHRSKIRRRQTLPSSHLLAKQERDTQTKLTETQTIQTQTSLDIPPHQQKRVPTTEAATTTTTAIVERGRHQGNGAIPKHSRKKSLPESSFFSRTDSSQTPYEILTSPNLRPRSNTYKEVNPRPHSSISMVYTMQDTELWQEKKQSNPAALRTERQFHTLERESNKVGRHSHPGELQALNLTYESCESVELCRSGVEEESELDLLECLTPAPYQFTDEADFQAHSNDDLTNSGTLEPKYRKTAHTYHKEIHPHSRSTETILFHNDKDPQPIVPNKKPGTPDIWLPRTIRA